MSGVTFPVGSITAFPRQLLDGCLSQLILIPPHPHTCMMWFIIITLAVILVPGNGAVNQTGGGAMQAHLSPCPLKPPR